MTLPTEEQMTASVLEAKDVTIAELRGEVAKWQDRFRFVQSWADDALAALERAEQGLRSSLWAVGWSFGGGLAIGLLLGVGL